MHILEIQTNYLKLDLTLVSGHDIQLWVHIPNIWAAYTADDYIKMLQWHIPNLHPNNTINIAEFTTYIKLQSRKCTFGQGMTVHINALAGWPGRHNIQEH